MHRLLPSFLALFLTALPPPLSADISFSNRAHQAGVADEGEANPGLAPRWGELVPQAVVTNRGRQAISGAALEGRIERRGQVAYSATRPVPDLEPGASASMRLEPWAPQVSGAHRFLFALAVDDEIAANNTWERTHDFFDFADVAPELGVADDGKGWAGAWGDCDNDGDLDLYLSNGGSLGRGANALYRNEEGRNFTEVSGSSGVADDGNGTGVAFADFDRDGYLDLFIARGGFVPPGETNRLFYNNGDGTFADVSGTSGLGAQQSSYNAAVGDYDRDGYLDLFVSQFRGENNALYHNEGDGTFADVSFSKNIQSYFAYSGSSSAFADYDNDGDVDLYASIFGDFDIFYSDVGRRSFGVAPVGNRGEAVGVTLGDYDGDGDLDLYVVNQDRRSALYSNLIDSGIFLDVAAESGTENYGPGTGCAFGDYDSDGDLDLFVVNGHGADRVYANRGDGTFADLAPAFGLADTSRARGVALGDYDGDGDLDAYIVNEGAPNRLYRSGGSPYNWLKVKTRGVESNADGIGTRIQVFAEGAVWTREVNGTAGFSQSSRTVHLGLGQRSEIDSMVVRWPRGRVDVLRSLAVNASLLLVEGELPTAVAVETAVGPRQFNLAQNYPNPFNGATVIEFETAAPGMVRLVLYDVLGQRVRTLADGKHSAGRHRVVWDGRDGGGHALASGVYFYRLWAGAREQRRSLVMLR